jgi:hypothetical protein
MLMLDIRRGRSMDLRMEVANCAVQHDGQSSTTSFVLTEDVAHPAYELNL